MKDYRYPQENLILFATIVLVFAVILFSAAATLCLSVFFVGAMFAMAFLGNRTHHNELMQNAVAINPTTAPGLAAVVDNCQQKLQPGAIDTYVVDSDQLNAYTFGIEYPKALVLYSSLVNIMDEDELAFVIGHEMGHVQLGHTWLNTILGGMAGIPASYGAAVLLTVMFRWWNRACEYSADRAGLLVCAKPDKAISALLKIISGDPHLDSREVAKLIKLVDSEDDSLSGILSETLSTHPMLIKRINQIRAYAASADFKTNMEKIQKRS